MSAFVCSPDHFKALAIFAASRGSYSKFRVDPRYIKNLEPIGSDFTGMSVSELATLYAETLYAENIRSVGARYPEDTLESMPGLVNKPQHIVVSYHDEMNVKYRLTPVAILKMCDGLEYQSCETDDYRQTVAFDLLDRIRGEAVHALPGYDDAPWDYHIDDTKAA